jgi:hypothetical protein
MEVIFIAPLFVVINKPGGLLSVPGRGPEMQECMVNRSKILFPDGIRSEDALAFPALLLRICPANDDGQGLPQLQHHPRPDHLQPSPNSYQSDWTYNINSHSIK